MVSLWLIGIVYSILVVSLSANDVFDAFQSSTDVIQWYVPGYVKNALYVLVFVSINLNLQVSDRRRLCLIDFQSVDCCVGTDYGYMQLCGHHNLLVADAKTIFTDGTQAGNCISVGRSTFQQPSTTQGEQPLKLRSPIH